MRRSNRQSLNRQLQSKHLPVQGWQSLIISYDSRCQHVELCSSMSDDSRCFGKSVQRDSIIKTNIVTLKNASGKLAGNLEKHVEKMHSWIVTYDGTVLTVSTMWYQIPYAFLDTFQSFSQLEKIHQTNQSVRIESEITFPLFQQMNQFYCDMFLPNEEYHDTSFISYDSSDRFCVRLLRSLLA